MQEFEQIFSSRRQQWDVVLSRNHVRIPENGTSPEIGGMDVFLSELVDPSLIEETISGWIGAMTTWQGQHGGVEFCGQVQPSGDVWHDRTGRDNAWRVARPAMVLLHTWGLHGLWWSLASGFHKHLVRKASPMLACLWDSGFHWVEKDGENECTVHADNEIDWQLLSFQILFIENMAEDARPMLSFTFSLHCPSGDWMLPRYRKLV